MRRKFFFLTVFIVLVELLFIAQTRIEAIMAVPGNPSSSDIMAVFKQLVNPPPTPNGGWFYAVPEGRVAVFSLENDLQGNQWIGL